MKAREKDKPYYRRSRETQYVTSYEWNKGLIKNQKREFIFEHKHDQAI